MATPTSNRILRLSNFLVLMTCAGLVPAQAPQANEAPPPDLSGTWVLNERLSEDPREKMREQMRGRSGGGRKGGGMGGGPEGGMDPEKMRQRMQERERAVQRLVVSHSEPRLRIAFADGSERVVVTDNKKHRRESGIGDVETRAKWTRNGRLEITATTEDGRKVSEVYRYSSGENRLYVTVTAGGDGRLPKLSFKRVYDRAADGSLDD